VDIATETGLDWKGDFERGARCPGTEETFEAYERSRDDAPAGTRLPYRTLRISRRFDALPQRIFDAWLNPRLAPRWLFATASRPIAHVEIDPHVGGAFCFVDWYRGEVTQYSGRYVEIVPCSRLIFTLVLPFAPQLATRVNVGIASANRGSRLTIVHENVPSADACDVGGRWTGMLYGLGVTLASFPHAGT
jgi:uncharacterized protein YndB with AHSA1/START domain